MGMETFSFDSDTYARNLNDKEKCSDRQLKEKHHETCMRITACSCSIGTGIGAAPLTLGMSLVPAAFSLQRMIDLEEQKRLIEEECRARKIPVPRERKRDVGIGSAVGIMTMGLGEAIEFGADSLAGEEVVEAASAASGGVDHLTPHGAAELANAASQDGHGFSQGVQETLTSQVHHLAHGASDYVPFQDLPCDASVAGVQAGVLGTMKVESLVGQQVGGCALDKAGKKIATRC